MKSLQGVRWAVHVCPFCGRQYPSPGLDRVPNDDRAIFCEHTVNGSLIRHPRLVEVEVTSARPFQPEITHEPTFFETGRLEGWLHSLRSEDRRLGYLLPQYTPEQWYSAVQVLLIQVRNNLVDKATAVTERMGITRSQGLLALAALCLDAVEALEFAEGENGELSPGDK